MAKKKKPLVTGGELKVFFIAATILSLIVGGVTALVVVLNVPPEPHRLPSNNPFKASVDDTIPKSLLVSDYWFPGPAGALSSRDWVISRQPMKAWSQQEVQRFWVNQSDSQERELPQKNDQSLLNILRDYP